MSKILGFYKAKGLDLISSDFTRPDEFQTGLENVETEETAEGTLLLKRKGNQVKGEADGAFGTIDFVRLNPTTDAEEEELLVISRDLKRKKEASLTVTYGGAGAEALLSLKYNPTFSTMVLTLTVDGTVVLNTSLGVGFDEVLPTTIADLSATIAAVSGFSTSTSGTTTISAAFLDVTPSYDLKSGSLTLKACEFERIPFSDEEESATSGPFYDSIVCNQDQDDFEPPSYVALNNVLYISNGYSGRLLKYDGLRCYNAGLPKIAFGVSAASGSMTAGTYQYRARLVHVDNTGNRIYGPLSDAYSITLGGSSGVSFDDCAIAGTGYNTVFAKVNGTQPVSANITVHAGHTLRAGDRVFVRSNSGTTETKVFSTTSTTVMLSTAVTVLDGAIIAPIGVEVFRTPASGTTFQQIGIWPNDGDSLGTLITEGTAALTGYELTIPDYDFGPPPPCRYVATYRGNLVVAGIPFTITNRSGSFYYGGDNPSNVWFGDAENVEGFPEDGSFTVLVDSDLGDKIKGIREVGASLIVGKEKSIARLVGDATDLSVEREWLSREIGLLSHASMKEIVRGRLVFLSTRGVMTVAETQAPEELAGYRIKPVVTANWKLPEDERLLFNRATCAVFSDRQLYILYVPAEGGVVTDTFVKTFPSPGDGIPPTTLTVSKFAANAHSRCLVLDYLGGRWMEWRDVNMAGGVAVHEGQLWFTEQKYSTYASAVKYRARRRLSNHDGSDYQDHVTPITERIKTSWHTLGKPALPKQYLRLKVSSIPNIPNNEPTLTVKQEANFLHDETIAQVSLSLVRDATLGYVEATTKLANGKFRSSRLILENSESAACPEIAGWELEVDAQYIEELKT